MQSVQGFTKTDRILLVVLAILRSPQGWIGEEQFSEIMGQPSRSQKYKIIGELVHANKTRPPILKKEVKNGTDGFGLSEMIIKIFNKEEGDELKKI